MTVQEHLEVSTRYRLRVADYLLLDEAGAFGDARTELLDGEIVILNAERRPYGFAKSEIAFALRDGLRAIGSNFYALIGASVDLGPHDMPLPDIIVTSEPRGTGAIPGSSVALLVEVAASTLAKDLKARRPSTLALASANTGWWMWAAAPSTSSGPRRASSTPSGRRCRSGTRCTPPPSRPDDRYRGAVRPRGALHHRVSFL